jgi:hypothetical protein
MIDLLVSSEGMGCGGIDGAQLGCCPVGTGSWSTRALQELSS